MSDTNTAPINTPVSAFSVPKIDLDKSRYDLGTYMGRVRHFADTTDPRTLFVGDEELKGAIAMLRDYRAGTLQGPVTEEQLWRAKKVTDSILHPDTGEKILHPFRMSAFTPVNLLVVAGMLGASTIPSTIFWQTINQTLNVCINYANRNASNEMTNAQLMQSYAIALSSSVGTAVGLGEWVKRTAMFSPAMKGTLLTLVPFTAVATANLFNISAMRWSEMKEGVAVKDKDGNVVGKSAIAGKTAVMQTIISRVLLIMPSMVVPPLLMKRAEQTPLLKRMPGLKMPLNLSILALSIFVSLPFGLSLFPQYGSAKTSTLEPHLQNLRNEKGELIEEVYFNKGL